MTRPLLVLGPIAAVAAALIGTVVVWPVAVVAGLILGTLAAAVAGVVQERRLTALARDVNRWLGAQEFTPVQLPASRAWSQLAVAVNALGAAFDRRGRRLRNERQARDTVVDALPEPAVLFGATGHVVRANARARERFGIQAADALTAAQAFGSADLARAVEEARGAGRSVEVTTRVDGDDLLALAVPLRDDVLVFIRDVSEQRRVEALRRDFVVNASHELKTPVAGLQALADALGVTIGRDEDRAADLVVQVRREVERLGRLVHDLLDLRRLEEAAPARAEAVDLAAIVRSEVGRLAAASRERRVRLDVDAPESAVLAGVEEDLRLVVANLLDNAVGYTDAGGTVTVQLDRLDGAWQLTVSDSGVGIPRQDLDRIFERFYRVDVARSRESGGTGLGLSLVRNAVERHGGSVRVESVLGEGSTFRVVLPIEGASPRS